MNVIIYEKKKKIIPISSLSSIPYVKIIIIYLKYIKQKNIYKTCFIETKFFKIGYTVNYT